MKEILYNICYGFQFMLSEYISTTIWISCNVQEGRDPTCIFNICICMHLTAVSIYIENLLNGKIQLLQLCPKLPFFCPEELFLPETNSAFAPENLKMDGWKSLWEGLFSGAILGGYPSKKVSTQSPSIHWRLFPFKVSAQKTQKWTSIQCK